MAGLQDFRKQHPEYDDMPDEALADALHRKFYADMPKDEYSRKMGLKTSIQEVPAQTSASSRDPIKVNAFDQAMHYATGGLVDKADAALQAMGVVGGGVPGDTFGERYGKNLANVRGAFGEYASENPGWDKGARAAGVVAPMLIGGAPAGILRNTAKGAAIGGAYGYGSTNDESLGENASAIGLGALLGGGAGGAGASIGRLGGKGAGYLATRNDMAPGELRAAQLLSAKMEKQGITPDEIGDFLTSNPKPVTMMDLGENSQTARLGRYLVTAPGKAGEDVTSFLNQRQMGARGRVRGDIDQLSPSDTYGAKDALIAERNINSDPLYTKAFERPGVGPADYEQTRMGLIRANSEAAVSGKRVRDIQNKIKDIETNKSGALAARGAAGQGTRDEYMALRAQLAEAQTAADAAKAAREAASTSFKTIQEGIGKSAPLTDERIAAFMSDPDIQAGMRQGLNIQRRLALARGEDFDPAAYAITHYDDAGNPVVGPVPTWRTLHAGREGLDAMIYSQADPLTGKLPSNKDINSLKELRASFGSYLQKANPDLKAADAAWSQPSQKLDALRLGGDFRRADPEQIRQAMQGSPQAPEFYRIGAARTMRDMADEAKDGADLGRRLSGDDMTRRQLEEIYGPDPTGRFNRAMQDETGMANTRRFVIGNSSTVNKLADLLENDGSPVLGDIIEGTLSGGPKGAIALPAIRAAKRFATGVVDKIQGNEARNLVLARLLTGTGKQGKVALDDLLSGAKTSVARKKRAQLIGEMLGGVAGRGGALTSAAFMTPSTYEATK